MADDVSLGNLTLVWRVGDSLSLPANAPSWRLACPAVRPRLETAHDRAAMRQGTLAESVRRASMTFRAPVRLRGGFCKCLALRKCGTSPMSRLLSSFASAATSAARLHAAPARWSRRRARARRSLPPGGGHADTVRGEFVFVERGETGILCQNMTPGPCGSGGCLPYYLANFVYSYCTLDT